MSGFQPALSTNHSENFGLNKNTLPPGSEVRFRPPPLWATYQRVLIIGSAVLVLQGALITVLLLQRRRVRTTENELFGSQQMLRTVLDTIPQRVFWKDRNSVYQGCNQPFAADCGCASPRELIGKNNGLSMTADTANRFWADDREVMETDRPKLGYEEQQKRNNGDIRWLKTSKVPLHDKSGRVIGVLGTYEDITEVKHNAEALRESEQRFRTLAQASFEGICLSENGIIFDMNDQFPGIYGYERAELIGREIATLVTPEWRERLRERHRQHQEGVFEHDCLRKNGTVFRAEARSKMVLLGNRNVRVTALRDITERKQMDEKVRQLSRAVEQSPVSVVITDRQGNIQYVNPKFSQITGYTLEEVRNQNPRVLKSGELSADTYRELWQRITAGQTWSGEFHNRKKNGELFWEWASISPIFDANGNITHYLGVKEDITRRKQLEEELRQSQKMEAFGQLAGGVAHDFNNLLTVIQGNVSLLQLQESLLPEHTIGLADIAKAAERAANLTRQLLTFSRRQIFQPKPLDMNEIVANTTSMLQRLIGEHIDLETCFAPGGAPVLADRNMMEQILVNLAVNSRDAMPKGGHLIIQTESVTLNAAEAQANPKAHVGAFVRLSVTDTGCGIAPEQMDHIFEPFFTTKEVGKGTGLGLATVFGIVAQHSGWIEVTSKVNQGTTFYVYLTRLAESQKVVADMPRTSRVRGGTETILLVEDETPVRSLTRTLLARHGYRIIEADSGVSALQLWPQHRDTVDLLLTDMVMPGGVSGRELAEQLLREKPGLKVIYASGYTDDMLGENSPLRDNPNFLEKPFQPQKLLQRVRSCLDEPKQAQ
jgi:PAS domain S-box-containing protein